MKNEWFEMTGLAKDLGIFMKPVNKGSCVVVWDTKVGLAEDENHLTGTFTYKVWFSDAGLVKLVDESNRMFKKVF